MRAPSEAKSPVLRDASGQPIRFWAGEPPRQCWSSNAHDRTCGQFMD